MKKTEISKLTIEDLNKRNESLKLRTGILIGLLIILFGAGVYVTIVDFKFLPVLIVALALFPLVIISYGQIKKLTIEIARRKI